MGSNNERDFAVASIDIDSDKGDVGKKIIFHYIQLFTFTKSVVT